MPCICCTAESYPRLYLICNFLVPRWWRHLVRLRWYLRHVVQLWLFRQMKSHGGSRRRSGQPWWWAFSSVSLCCAGFPSFWRSSLAPCVPAAYPLFGKAYFFGLATPILSSTPWFTQHLTRITIMPLRAFLLSSDKCSAHGDMQKSCGERCLCSAFMINI